MKYCVTGCAGFIGSNLVDKLLKDGHKVIGIDNLSTGKMEFLKKSLLYNSFTFYQKDLYYESKDLNSIINECDTIFHLAAHADVKDNIKNSIKCVEQNILVTQKLLEAIRGTKIKNIVFSSTGSVYGETDIVPTPETALLRNQTSIYSATKLSCEALIEAYCEAFGFSGYIFRFVSILGQRYSHGHIYDFYKQLSSHPDYLRVLGNGNQKKSYLHVNDCINGILVGLSGNKKINIYNLGTDETILVKESIEEILYTLKLKPKVMYGKEDRGWIGDNPVIFLDCSKIRDIGWKPEFSIRAGIQSTLEYFKENKI